VRKNGLGRLEANAVARGARAWAARWFRPRPVVPDPAFQDESEPYPGHWRSFPQPWADTVTADQLCDALETLPATWREVLLRHDGPAEGPSPAAVPADLSPTQERDILSQARAALRDALDAAQNRTR
jgi:RNA polymerase sigma-70 factor (ECF subfamily)